MFSRTTVTWNEGKQLLAPYINNRDNQIADAPENTKRDYIGKLAGLTGAQKEMVLKMVEDKWRNRPSAGTAKASFQTRVIQGYTLSSELGAGAFGKVYYATKNGNSYAVKRIDVERRDDTDRIMKEVQSHRKLSHVNVVKYYNNFNIDDAVWIVMEYCNGGNLNSFILKQNQSYKRLLDFTQQVCRGVDYLHSQDVIHRDIKPDNIMIYSGFWGYTLKLADFGLSRVWESFNYQSPYYEFNYDPRGPPYYSAPEITNGNATWESDIFSLGCMVLAIFSRTSVPWIGGKPLLAPYIGTSRLQIADATVKQKRSYIQKFVRLPCRGDEELLQKLVFSMVQKNWQDRPNARTALSRANKIAAGCTIL